MLIYSLPLGSNCEALGVYFWIEVLAVIFGLAYLFFLIQQNVICWIFGIIGSLLSIYLFYDSRLYSEAILYSYYVLMGGYGFYMWRRKSEDQSSLLLVISELKWLYHIVFLLVGSILAWVMAWFFDTYTNADKPYLDAFTTIFSFLATYLEARKVVSAWLYWIVLNGVTVLLYFGKGLDVYAGLSVVYFIMSFLGYVRWKRSMS